MYLLSITRGVVLIRKTSGQLKLIFHDTFIKHQKKKMSMKTNFKFLTLIESSCFEKKNGVKFDSLCFFQAYTENVFWSIAGVILYIFNRIEGILKTIHDR